MYETPSYQSHEGNGNTYLEPDVFERARDGRNPLEESGTVGMGNTPSCVM